MAAALGGACFSSETAKNDKNIMIFQIISQFLFAVNNRAVLVWAFRRIFRTRKKNRKKVPHGGILHLLFSGGFVMIKALYCEKCDNTTIA
ncbi:MAG: hypothetical protein K2O45_04675 [Oscillospiraceae bacterium]|nr:hypothetical protein [Oscillospiraceae bacterium]